MKRSIDESWISWFRRLSIDPVQGWQKAPYWYKPYGAYTALQFPIRKGILQTPWLVIDECYMVDGSLEIKCHDDIDHADEFLKQDIWYLWPNKRKLADWHNEPYKRTTRLAFARMTAFTSQHAAIIDNHWLAKSAVQLQSLIVKDPEGEHQTDRLDWSPSGQVWKDGLRWVKIIPEEANEKAHESKSREPMR